MNLKNSRLLDKNNYNSVLISDKAITYSCKRDYETFSNKNGFSSSLKLLSDEEKKSEVIKHFLNNSRIMSINGRSSYRGRHCITLNGTRILRTYIPLNANDKKAIWEKYSSDRLKTVYEENYDRVHISIHNGSSDCYLYNESASLNKPSLNITLCSNNEIVIPTEIEFLKKLIPFLMGDNIGEYEIFHETESERKSWIGNGISGINHDIICGVTAEKTVRQIWNIEYSKKVSEESNQLTIDEYVKVLKL